MPWVPTSDTAAARAEDRLLRQFVDNRITQTMVPIADNTFINTVEVHPPSHSIPSDISEKQPDTRIPVVFVHGFASGLAFWCRNLSHAAEDSRFRVFAIDMLGFGRSSRPEFPRSDPQAGEDFFIDSLEQWRVAMGLEKLVIVGHSLGGFITGCFALRYPDSLRKAVLVSPVGVPPAPDREEEEKAIKARRLGWRFTLFRWLWDKAVTPQALLRVLGPAGPSIALKMLRRRFAGHDDDLVTLMADYAYHANMNGPASGEHAMCGILQVGAWARNPLGPRLSQLTTPVSFYYGTYDWMSRSSADHYAPSMRDVSVATLPGGHHLYLDDHESFNAALAREFSDIVV